MVVVVEMAVVGEGPEGHHHTESLGFTKLHGTYQTVEWIATYTMMITYWLLCTH